MSTRRTRQIIILMLLALMPLSSWAQQPEAKRYQVAACDWMMLKRQRLGEFGLSRQIGADGVELDMGPLGKRILFENKLRDPLQAEKFRHTADSLGIQVPSVAMSGFYAQNFIKRENYLDLVQDCINTMKIFGSKVAYLPLGGSGREWQKGGAEYDSLIVHLHRAGELALKNGVTIGIRTGLDAKKSISMLKDIKSRGIKIYYSFQDACDNGFDICKELKKLGRKRIIQIHASNTDGVNLKNDPEINMPEVKKTLDKMGWSGWLVVERSRDVKQVRNVKFNFGNNVAYLKQVFQ